VHLGHVGDELGPDVDVDLAGGRVPAQPRGPGEGDGALRTLQEVPVIPALLALPEGGGLRIS
jgi:hypothetical protein